MVAETNMGRAPPPKTTRRKKIGEKRKGSNKNRDPLAWTEKRIETRIARDQAKLAILRAKKAAKTPARSSTRARVEPSQDVSEPTTKVARTKLDEADQRVMIRSLTTMTGTSPSLRAAGWVRLMTLAGMGAMARAHQRISLTPCASHGPSTPPASALSKILCACRSLLMPLHNKTTHGVTPIVTLSLVSN